MSELIHPTARPDAIDPRVQEVASWLSTVLADALQVGLTSVMTDVPLQQFGLDSVLMAMLLAEIDDELGITLDPADLPPILSLNDLAAMVVELDEYRPYRTEDSDVA